MTTFATTLAPYIADLIECCDLGKLRRALEEDGHSGASYEDILGNLPEATRLAADLIYTGRK